MDSIIPFLRSLFILHILFCTLRAQENYEPYKNIEIQQEKYDNECVCFERNPYLLSIPKILDSQTQDIERLVIYVYRLKNGTLWSYVPHITKQERIPDLHYEKGDLITEVTNKKLNEIFTNSNNVLEYNTVIYDSSKSLESENGIVTADNNDLTNKGNNHGLGISVHQVNYSIPQSNLHTSEIVDDITPLINIQTILDKPDDVPSQYIPPTKKLKPGTNIEYSTSQVIIINGTKDNTVDILTTDPVKFNNTFVRTVYTPPENLDGTFNQWFTQQMKNIELDQSIRSEPLNINTLEHLIQTALKDYGMFVSSKGVLTDSHGTVLNMTNLHIRPLLIGNKFEYNKILKSTNKTFSIPENTSFMESLLVALLYPPKIIAMIPLGKVTIPKMITNNHEPDTIVFKKFRKMNHDDKVLVKDISIKDGASKASQRVRINENKSKVLTYADPYFNQHQQANVIKTVPSFTEKPYYDHSYTNQQTPNSFQKHGKGYHNFGENDDKITLRKLKDESKQLKNYESDISIDALVELMQKIVNEHQNGPQKVSIEKILKELTSVKEADKKIKRPSKGQQRPKIKGRLMNRFNEPRRRFPSLLTPLLKRIQTSSNPVVTEPPVPPEESEAEDIEEEKDHGFRIIGGAAATGSGSPISNRGRSANTIFN